MSDEIESALKAIANGVTKLPAPIEQSLFKAIGHLVGGLTAIPKAWFSQKAQSINDITAAHSAASVILAQAVAKEALADPAIMQAAAETLLPSAIIKARNRIQIARRIAEHTAEEATEEGASRSRTPDDDWLNTFARFAEDASSEKLQDLFARIMSGELLRPGSFSPATIRTVGEIDKAIAEDFSLVWAKSAGGAVDHTSDFNLGEWFSRWKRLAEVGLMSPLGVIQYLPSFLPFHNGNALWSPMVGGNVTLVVHYSQQCAINWRCIEFTRVGRQIGSILANPDYKSNIRQAAQKWTGQPGVVKMDILVDGRVTEVL
jgi:hypothetical protein